MRGGRPSAKAPLALALALVALACCPASALGAIAFRNAASSTLFFVAGSGEQNDLTVTLDPTNYTITDRGPGVTVAAGSNCQATPDPQTVTCAAPGVTELDVDLGEMNDAATLLPDTPAFIQGGDGDDELNAGGGDDEVLGDSIISNAVGDDDLSGGDGDDAMFGDSADLSTMGENSLDGGTGRDDLWGSGGADTLQGGADGDTLRGFGGADSADGGAGPDLVTGGDGQDAMLGGDGNDEIGSPLEFLTGAPPERGADRLDGGPGDDIVRPGAGPTQGVSDADVLTGGPGRDVVPYEKRASPLAVFIDGGANDGVAGEGDNVGLDVEKLVGGASDDRLVGGPGGDEIDGSGGGDVIEGGGGGDVLDGGATDSESDSLAGGEGGDDLRGNAGDDALRGDGGADTLDGGTGDDGLQGGTEPDQLAGGPGVDELGGGSGDDQLDGAAPVLLGVDGRDRLRGDGGNDTMRGGPADDTLEGGGGADDLRGEAGRDAADYGLVDDAVEVSLDGRPNDGERGERDNVRTDIENVAGGGVEDTLTGSGGRNRLDGGGGEDYVDGRKGSDDLRGGSSVDVVRARDGRTRDTVSCGRGKDFAIVERRDRVRRDCEAFDNGLRRVPRTGVAFVLRSVRGSNGFGPPGMRRTVPLEDRLRLPMASQVDARKGSVGLVSSRTPRSRPSGVFSGGLFQVLQSRSRGSVAELRLRGGDFGVCRRAGAGRSGAALAQRRIIRRLRARARGGYRASGRHSAATVRGTVFSVVDRCDGTLTRVRSGVVRVRDFRRRRTVTVRAGKSYLARARNR
jgi:Ca2+-binding RTX toxin-like protein